MMITKRTVAIAATAVLMACGIQWRANGDMPKAGVDAACPLAFEKSGYCADFAWLKFPGEDVKGEALVRFWKKDALPEYGQFSAPANAMVFVDLWMPEHGHGGGKLKTAAFQDVAGKDLAGVYRVTNVSFIMPGRWDIRIQLRTPDGQDQIERVVIPIEIQ